MKNFFLIAILFFASSCKGQTANELIEKGTKQYDEHNYNAAKASYTKAIELDSKNPVAYYSRALVNSSLGNFNAALSDYTKAIELDPKDGMAYFNRAQIKDTLKDYDGAVSDYTLAIAKDPNLEEGFFLRDAQMKRGIARYKSADYQGAIDDLTEIIKDENNKEAYYYRGMAKISLKQTESGCLDLSHARDLGFEQAKTVLSKNCK